MAKAMTGHYRPPQAHRAVVHCPKDAGLAGLLTGTGGRFEGLLNGLAAAAVTFHRCAPSCAAIPASLSRAG
jgi:hypothetical protein